MRKLLFVLCISWGTAWGQHHHSMAETPVVAPMAESRTDISGKPKTVVYTLNVTDTVVNYTGKKRHAIALNGSIPSPTLYFTEGDTAVIYVHNSLNVATIIHWHGLILPNQYDGVPYLTTAPIRPGQTHLFKFPLVQHGTYWYHSHAEWQQQSGMYGAFVIHKRRAGTAGPDDEMRAGDKAGEGGKAGDPAVGTGDKGGYDDGTRAGVNAGEEGKAGNTEKAKSDGPEVGAGDKAEKIAKEYTVLLSDWTNEKPYEVDRSLHAATDWYGIRKKSSQDYAQALKEGYLKTKLTSEWKRMLAMDVSDVAYDLFTINGKREDTVGASEPGGPTAESGRRALKAGDHVGMSGQVLKAGDKIRLHIVNGSSSTYFWLQYAGGKMKVVANDGMDVEPVEVDRMIVAVAETYDIEVTIPESGRYELRATSEDRTGSVSLWVGTGSWSAGGKDEHKGMKEMDTLARNAPVLPRLHYFEGMKMMNGMMKMNGDMDGMGMQMSNQVMDMNRVMYPEAQDGGGGMKMPGMGAMSMSGMDTSMKMGGHDDSHAGMGSMNEGKSTTEAMNMTDGAGKTDGMGVTLNYSMLRSPVKTNLPEAPFRELRFDLTGNMNRYVWSINNKTVSETDKILIRRGENIRIILYNGTMMRHPMHLHGHFFRVLNGQGDYAPLKNTLDILPMETDTLEFAPTESGDWFFHCHILYHMMSGMGRIFSYADSPPNPEVPDPKMALKMVYMDDRMIHPTAKVGLESNGSDGEVTLFNTRYRFQTEWRVGLNARSGYESESHFGRYLGRMQFWFPYVGWDFRYRKNNGAEKSIFGQRDDKDDRKVFCAGVEYMLPMLVIADARVDMKGKLRLQLSREDVPVTSRLRFTFMMNTDKEYMAGLRYIVTKYFSLSTHYDSDMKLGAGITLNY